MLQDDSKQLSAWLASKPDAMQLARQAADRIQTQHTTESQSWMNSKKSPT